MKSLPLRLFVVFACLFSRVLPIPNLAATSSSSQASASSSAPAPKASPSKPGVPSAADIAAAKASHKVWVNRTTGIYHRGGRWYGKTKDGKFMTADEARKAGYKPAKRD